MESKSNSVIESHCTNECQVTAREGHISGIFFPETEETRLFSHVGILVSFGDGDCQLWPAPDEELTFLSRERV